jgi:hypothetical protein
LLVEVVAEEVDPDPYVVVPQIVPTVLLDATLLDLEELEELKLRGEQEVLLGRALLLEVLLGLLDKADKVGSGELPLVAEAVVDFMVEVAEVTMVAVLVEMAAAVAAVVQVLCLLEELV